MHHTTDAVRKNTYLIYLYTGLSFSFVGVFFRGCTQIEKFVDILFRCFGYLHITSRVIYVFSFRCDLNFGV